MAKKINPDATRSDKLLVLYRLLLTNNRKYSTAELTKILNCSKQSVRCIVDALNFNSEIDIQEETDPKTRVKRYFIEHGLHGINEPIDLDGYRQMELCRDIVGDLLPDDDRKKLNLALQNASNYLSRKDRTGFKTVSFASGLTKGYINYDKLKKQLHDLYYCINEKKCCVIKHQKYINGEVRTYCIAPLKIMVLHECFYLFAYIVRDEGDAIRQFAKPTNFAVHRIVETCVQKERSFDGIYPQQEEVDEQLFGLIRDGNPFTVRLRFLSPESVTYIADRVFSKDQTTQLNADGSLDLTFSSDSYYEVLSFILAYGSSVIVLEPQRLKDAVKSELKKLQKLYEE